MSASLRRLGSSDLEIVPLALGTNVFGWTADEATSFAVLDAFTAAGGNFIDTADSYSFWRPGNRGGEAETIIGSWLARRSRAGLVIATKVSQHPDFKGLAPATIRRGIDASLSRLGVDHVDLYYAHFDDPETPLVESIAALSALVDDGKVRYVGISNFSPARIEEWLALVAEHGFHPPVAVEPMYSLVERGIENDVLPIARAAGLGVVPYYTLARGFLTGKYRDGAQIDSPRAEAASAYATPRGLVVIATLDAIAHDHGVATGTIAMAWVAAQPGITAPIASARNVEQLPMLLDYLDVTLTAEELDRLDRASA